MRASPTFKNEKVICKNCGFEEPKRNSRHYFCSQNCLMKWRRKNNIKPTQKNTNTTEYCNFEWRCYPNGIL